MVYIYLVIGCWLKYAFPVTGELTDALWQGCAWGFAGASFVVAALLLLDKMQPRDEQMRWTQVGAIILAGALSGHPIATLAMLAGVASIKAAEKYRKKELAKK